MGPPALAEAYAGLLEQERWQWFLTLTFDPRHRLSNGGVLAEKADKAFKWFVFQINRRVYGTNWNRKPHGGVIWARGHEAHANGRPHFHAVMAAPDRNLNDSLQRYAWHELWFREYGRNKIEQPRNQEEVRRYVSKYVSKDGDVDLSANFAKWRPPAFDFPVGWESGAHAAKPLLPAEQRSSGGSFSDPAYQPGLSLTLPPRLEFGHSFETHSVEDLDLDLDLAKEN